MKVCTYPNCLCPNTEVCDQLQLRSRQAMEKDDSYRISINLEGVHHLASRNRRMVMKAKKVGCFYCRKIYEADKVYGFTRADQSAICPYCNVDSVIPSGVLGFDVDDALLNEMYLKYFRV